VYAADRPLERGRTTAITSPLQCGEAFGFEIKQPMDSSRWKAQQQILLQGSPEPIAVQPTADLTPRVPGYLGGPLRIPARSWSAKRATPSGEASARSWKNVLDMVPCGKPAMACRLRPEPLPSRWVPMASRISPTSAWPTPWSASRPDGWGRRGFSSPAQRAPRSRSGDLVRARSACG